MQEDIRRQKAKPLSPFFEIKREYLIQAQSPAQVKLILNFGKDYCKPSVMRV